MTKYPDEILRLATGGEDFNQDYYIDYLIAKYDR